MALAEGFTEKELEGILAEIENLKDEPPINPLAGMGPFMNGGQEEETDEEETEGPGDEAVDSE